MKMNTIIGTILLFSPQHDKYWRFHGTEVSRGYPKEIERNFPGIPNDVNAAFEMSDGNFYFFKGNYQMAKKSCYKSKSFFCLNH